MSRKKNLVDPETLQKLIDQGYSEYRIGIVCGVCQTTIHKRLLELGLKTKYTARYPFDEAQIRTWVSVEHRTAIWVAKQYDCHPSTVQLYLTKMGIEAEGNNYRHQGKDANHWKGGAIRKSSGYIVVLCKEHPRADSLGYVPQQVLVMESHIGRYLEPDEIAHHKNGIKDDNRLENLQLMTDFEHRSHHASERHRKRRESQAITASASSIQKE